MDLELTLGDMLADQACKECRRRKARCSRAIPTCNLCIKYRRHCLYEKHSRTPLTRKHLTEVEERLERAEALVRQMRRNANAAASEQPSTGAASNVTSSPARGAAPTQADFNFASLGPRPGTSSETSPPARDGEADSINGGTPLDTKASLVSPQAMSTRGVLSTPRMQHSVRARPQVPDRDGARPQPNPLESPPTTEDFEWDEQETITNHSLSPNEAGEADDGSTPVLDGMASLSVDEKEAGYLGVASGAALLRLIEPDRRRRRSSQITTARPHARLSVSGGAGGPTSAAAAASFYQGAAYYHPFSHSFTSQPDPNRHIVDSMIDGYFRQYHLSYPIIHEPTFRAQYSEVIPRPSGDSWLVLAYVVAAIGVFATATTTQNALDQALFARAKGVLNFSFLETGNLTLVQALTLASNYQQKRDKPNAGYNYLGLAVRMAMGLGLHKEFQGWQISPLSMEIRRRVWWSLCVFDVGATVTFSRPQVWPYDGVEVSLPLNVHDRELTAASKTYPPESDGLTPYTAVRTQASFHIATLPIYARVISRPFPGAAELLALERAHFEPWAASAPPSFREGTSPADVPPRYAFAHAVMSWRSLNFRIIMYRPFVIRWALRDRCAPPAQPPPQPPPHPSSTAEGDTVLPEESTTTTPTSAGVDASEQAACCERCLRDAESTIDSVASYWASSPPEGGHTRLAGWYALYFLFQAALIPCVCLRNAPFAPQAGSWRRQIGVTLRTIAALADVNPSAGRSHQAIADLCGRYLDDVGGGGYAAGVIGPGNATPGQLREGGEQSLGQHEQLSLQDGMTPEGGGAVGGHAGGMAALPRMVEDGGRGSVVHHGMDADEGGGVLGPVGDSPQTQINSVFSMMWPNAQPLEAADLVMGDDAWMEFLGG